MKRTPTQKLTDRKTASQSARQRETERRRDGKTERHTDTQTETEITHDPAVTVRKAETSLERVEVACTLSPSCAGLPPVLSFGGDGHLSCLRSGGLPSLPHWVVVVLRSSPLSGDSQENKQHHHQSERDRPPHHQREQRQRHLGCEPRTSTTSQGRKGSHRKGGAHTTQQIKKGQPPPSKGRRLPPPLKGHETRYITCTKLQWHPRRE